jgi:hypothetical protein
MQISSIGTLVNAAGTKIGVKIVYTDPTKGTKTISFADIPNARRNDTAAQLTAYLNTIVNPAQDPNMTRAGSLLGCYAVVQVNIYVRDTIFDVSVYIGDDPVPLDIFNPAP